MIPLKDDNPTRTFPFINWALIIINVVVFFYQVQLPPHAAKAFLMANATVPMRIPAFLAGYLGFKMAFYPLFTSMFLHGGLMHLLGNMLFLYVFGDNVEDYFGHLGYLIFYLFCGVGSGFIHVLFNLTLFPAGDWGERGDQRGDGRVPGVVPAGECADAVLYLSDSDSSGACVGVLVRAAVCRGNWGTGSDGYGRRGVLGAYWRIFDGAGDCVGGEEKVIGVRISDIRKQEGWVHRR